MITCDRCEKRILGGDRVVVPTKIDPYGDSTDFCKDCSGELNEALTVVRKAAHKELNDAVAAIMQEWGNR